MAKKSGHKKGKQRARPDRHTTGSRIAALSAAAETAADRRPARTGLDATRGSVSGAYRSWAAEYGRRQAHLVGAELDGAEGGDVFVLAPLTTRTVETPDDEVVTIEMGLPIVAARGGDSAVVASDRLAITAARQPAIDSGGALSMLGLGQSPEMAAPEVLFATYVPSEAMRGVRAADAIAWYLARALERGHAVPTAASLTATTGAAFALLRPTLVPRETVPLTASDVAEYAGYGDGADDEPVAPDITAAPERGGFSELPLGTFLYDDGSPLGPLLDDLRDYVIGLWPYEYFDLAELTTRADEIDGDGETAARAEALARFSGIVRRLDEVLSETIVTLENALADEGRPPSWIAEETAPARTARETLRSTTCAQEILPRLGPLLFDLEMPPRDYVPDAEGDPG